MAPAALSILAVNFPEGQERNRALGIFGAVAGVSASVGVIASGLLTDGPGWRWVFFINIPVGVLLLGLAALFLAADRPESRTARIAQRTAPDRVISTVDPEARHAHKTRRAYRDGYKAHVTAEPDTGLVTACDIGPGNTGDAEAAADLLAGEPAGTEVLGDSAYSAGELRAHLQGRG